MAQNIATTFYNTADVNARILEVPGADFVGGANAGSNGCGVGVNTGNPDPKPSDWSIPVAPADHYFADSQYIGKDPGANSRITLAPNGVVGSSKVAFARALVAAAPGVVFNANAGVGGAINRTSVTLQIGQHAWGEVL